MSIHETVNQLILLQSSGVHEDFDYCDPSIRNGLTLHFVEHRSVPLLTWHDSMLVLYPPQSNFQESFVALVLAMVVQ